MKNETKKRKWQIYVLIEPRQDESILPRKHGVRYVGKTHESVKRRFCRHINNTKNNHSKTYVNHWIKSILDVDLEPICKIIAEGKGEGWQIAERNWIAHFRQFCDLCNLTDGGEGSLGYKPTPETIQKTSSKLRGRKFSPERRAEMKAHFKGRVFSHEHRAKIVEKLIELNKSPEQRSRISKRSRSPEHIAMLTALNRSLKRRKEMAVMMIKRNKSPEHMAKIAATRRIKNIIKHYNPNQLSLSELS